MGLSLEIFVNFLSIFPMDRKLPKGRNPVSHLCFPSDWQAQCLEPSGNLWNKFRAGNVFLYHNTGFNVRFPNIKLEFSPSMLCSSLFNYTLYFENNFIFCPNELNIFSFNTVVLG